LESGGYVFARTRPYDISLANTTPCFPFVYFHELPVRKLLLEGDRVMGIGYKKRTVTGSIRELGRAVDNCADSSFLFFFVKCTILFIARTFLTINFIDIVALGILIIFFYSGRQ